MQWSLRQAEVVGQTITFICNHIMQKELQELLNSIKPVDRSLSVAAQAHLDDLTKP